jgi:hypothetical protein
VSRGENRKGTHIDSNISFFPRRAYTAIMSSISDFPARGRIIEVDDRSIVFNPAGTTYQLHLTSSSDGAISISDRPVQILIRVQARKVYTVPSGGNFVQPIFGPPKIIQGRVKFADDRTIVVQAGVPIICELPVAESAIDLPEGPLRVGHMANVVALRGATFQFAEVASAAT